MSNPIFDMMKPLSAKTPQGNMMQNIISFAKTVQGNPEQIVRGLISSGKMSQQQFNEFSKIAQQILPRKK